MNAIEISNGASAPFFRLRAPLEFVDSYCHSARLAVEEYVVPYKTINISLPESMKTEVEREVEEGHFASTSDFIRDLIRDYLEDKRIERLVLEGLNDPDVSTLKREDFKEMKRLLREKLDGKRSKDEI